MSKPKHQEEDPRVRIPAQFKGQQNFAAFFKVPLNVVKDACKNPKCSAFRNGRIHTVELLQFIFTAKAADSGIDWKKDREESQAKRERIKLAADQERLADKETIVFGLNKITSTFFSALDRVCKIELPPALKGLDELSIQKELLKKASKLKEEMREGFNKLAQKQTKEKGDE